MFLGAGRISMYPGRSRAQVSGGHSGGETPVPIPNTAVKPARADGTWGATPWESRSLPEFIADKALGARQERASGASSRSAPGGGRTGPDFSGSIASAQVDRDGDLCVRGGKARPLRHLCRTGVQHLQSETSTPRMTT